MGILGVDIDSFFARYGEFRITIVELEGFKRGLVLICHSVLGTENTVSQRIQTIKHKISKMVLQ